MTRLTVFLIALVMVARTWAFAPFGSVALRSSSRTSVAALEMAGGRSQAEKSMTTKQIFRELRGKLNEAAQIPGFFDVGQHVVRPTRCQRARRLVQLLTFRT